MVLENTIYALGFDLCIRFILHWNFSLPSVYKRPDGRESIAERKEGINSSGRVAKKEQRVLGLWWLKNG